jgi:hypothetical protein
VSDLLPGAEATELGTVGFHMLLGERDTETVQQKLGEGERERVSHHSRP